MKTYTIEFLNEKCDKMFNYLREPMPSMDNEDAVMKRLSFLGTMLAESGEYKAAAQYMVDDVVHGEIGKAIFRIADERAPASTLNMYVKAAAKDWNYVVNSMDRINSAASKMIMSIQVLISYEKAKMNI
jgi:hypothetical protein